MTTSFPWRCRPRRSRPARGARSRTAGSRGLVEPRPHEVPHAAALDVGVVHGARAGAAGDAAHAGRGAWDGPVREQRSARIAPSGHAGVRGREDVEPASGAASVGGGIRRAVGRGALLPSVRRARPPRPLARLVGLRVVVVAEAHDQAQPGAGNAHPRRDLDRDGRVEPKAPRRASCAQLAPMDHAPIPARGTRHG